VTEAELNLKSMLEVTKRSGSSSSDSKRERFLHAAVTVLRHNAISTHHHALHQQQQQQQLYSAANSSVVDVSGASALPLGSVTALLSEMCDVVKPPRRLPRFAVLLRRAPTQEEFFRGNLPTNPIYSSDVAVVSGKCDSPQAQFH
jgi:hypothetical protein